MPYFDLDLNPQQAAVFAQFQAFADPKTPAGIFLLRGYAGTGKTTLVRGLVRYLEEQHASVQLLASTGRAAKVLANKAGREARTIHSLVYTFKGVRGDIEAQAEAGQKAQRENAGKQLLLDFAATTYAPPPGEQPAKHRFYLVDEASMISDKEGLGNSNGLFGDGRVLRDLLAYDQAGKFVFIGDPCQLPPVDDVVSPALDCLHLRDTYRRPVTDTELTQVMRQQGTYHGILSAAEQLRHLAQQPPGRRPYLPVKAHRGDQVVIHRDLNGLYQQYLQTIKDRGDTYAPLLCHANWQRVKLNQMIRGKLGRPTGLLQEGDLLLATQNTLLAPIANGDLLRVQEIGPSEVRVGLQFTRVKVSLAHRSAAETHELFMFAHLLESSDGNLDEASHQQLLIDFAKRMRTRQLKQDSPEFRMAMMQDPYLNALRAVYGYAMTGHKAQGGEWDEVFVWQENYITQWNPVTAYRWWYTVITRARQRVHLPDAAFVG